MITKDTFKSVLGAMGFTENGSFFEKQFPAYACSLKVDFHKKELIYPEEIRGRERNIDFDAPENFVVFECVNRLLSKGYRPEDIELEKEWHLGHDPKSGRADICVSFNDEMLFIIECKTAGKEFDKALKDTLKDGAQLFSYWQQERATQWLVLYASDFVDGDVVFRAPTINCSDDKNVEQLAQKNRDIKLYKDAFTAEQKYEVWKDTYSSQILDDLIFSTDTQAYTIGLHPLLKKNLRDFAPEDRIVNKFEEILRHNNVSDKENAFNRLIALFICKLVDEITKSEGDVVDFQYKQGTDTYESLQDRLQKLHTEGMEKFMREKILYVPNDYPEHLFSTYTGRKRQKAIEDLQNTIRILKFYSNNDFTFKDVHNEELFYQNGKILVEVVQLFEKYRIVYPAKHQFLGDLFEQLLSKGFKQNEGQFFTPMPITRFIWDSLPVQDTVCTGGGTYYPKIIDYACGAGHFLTEAVEAINAFVEDGDNDWVRSHIFGIEKDYRLARVSKISLFMNGAGEGNIIFGDGLESQPDKGIENGTFDILVANPPYSVKDFKQHLQLRSNQFELLERIGDNGGEIEVLFIERISQLLKSKGVAAVILPSSILSNDSASYIGARELVLQDFKIRAIVQFGNNTFGETGTNTIALFLEKRNEPPKYKDMVSDSVNSILAGDDLSEWTDIEIFEAYSGQIGVEEEEYKAFAKEGKSISELCKNEYFKPYNEAFEVSADIEKLKKSKAFAKLSSKQQDRELRRRFYIFAKGIERQKLYYFALTYEQNTLVITAPPKAKDEQIFLGYKWSKAKGNEGIHVVTPGGKLFNDADRKANNTLACAIRESFGDVVPELTEENQAFAGMVKTTDMLDYSRVLFNKALRLNVDKVKVIKSSYPLCPLGSKCEVRIGGTPARAISEYYEGKNLWVSVKEMGGRVIEDTNEKITDEAVKRSNVKLVPKGTTLLSFKLSIGKTAIAGADLYTNEAIAALIPLQKTELLDGYLFCLFNSKLIELEQVGLKAFGKSLNKTYLENEVMIPLPPISVQKAIIAACGKIDKEYEVTRMSEEEYRSKIERVFDEQKVIISDTDTD